MERERKLIALKKKDNKLSILVFVILILLTLITMKETEYKVIVALKAIPGIIDFIFKDFLPPAINSIPVLLPSLLDTIYMAIVSTVLGGIISLILALLCAEQTTPSKFLMVLIRAFASALRNIPALAWALIFVPAFGIGKTVGVMALVMGALGTMTRSFTETIEEIDLGGIEALRACGASYWQVLRNGVIPQAIPGIVSWGLYNFELDVRASTIIGMVGGGGIGFFIQSNIKLFKYRNATMAIIIVGLLVIVTEFISKKIREKMI